MLAHLFQVTEQYGMETQPQLILLQKTLLIIEGVAYDLNPKLNMWELAEPWLRNWSKHNLNLENKIKTELTEFCNTIKTLPHITENIKKISDLQIKKSLYARERHHYYGQILYFISGGLITFLLLKI